MKTNSLRNYIAIAVVILLSSGCKSPSLLSEEKVTLPETFVGGNLGHVEYGQLVMERILSGYLFKGIY